MALYAGALLTHETAILFPLIVAAYVFLIERGADEPRQTLLNLFVATVRVSAPFALLELLVTVSNAIPRIWLIASSWLRR